MVATGLRDLLPEVGGLRERWANDVLHCPYCHGWEVRDRPLGVLGGSAGAVRYAQIVRQWSADVVFFAPAGSLTAAERGQLLARAIGVVEGDVAKVVVTAGRLSGVELRDGRVVPREAVFVPPRFEPHNNLLVALGCDLDGDGWPAIDGTGQTTRARRLGGRQRRRPAGPGDHRGR